MQRKTICFVTAVPATIRAFLLLHIECLKHEYHVVIISNYTDEKLEKIEGVELIHLPIVRKISIWNDLIALIKLCCILRERRFASVHSVTPKAGLLTALAGFILNLPIRIHWFTGQVWATRKGFSRLFLKSFDKIIAILATHILADSNSQRAFIINEGVCKSDKIEVIADGSISGVDIKKFSPSKESNIKVRREYGIADESQIVLFLGRLNKDKGLRELSHAINIVAPSVKGVHWLIVGPDEGGLTSYIKNVTKGNEEYVHIVGPTKEADKYMAAADIFCLPSYREGFGTSILEAAASGVPAVASRIYGLTDAVEDGVTGVLVDPKSSSLLADALIDLLNDKARLIEMGKSARIRAVEKFSSEIVVQGLSDYYRKLIN